MRPPLPSREADSCGSALWRIVQNVSAGMPRTPAAPGMYLRAGIVERPQLGRQRAEQAAKPPRRVNWASRPECPASKIVSAAARKRRARGRPCRSLFASTVVPTGSPTPVTAQPGVEASPISRTRVHRNAGWAGRRVPAAAIGASASGPSGRAAEPPAPGPKPPVPVALPL